MTIATCATRTYSVVRTNMAGVVNMDAEASGPRAAGRLQARRGLLSRPMSQSNEEISIPDPLKVLPRVGDADNSHTGHWSKLSGTYWCDTCDSPYCELA
jgi:hypothetical protein